MTNRRREQQNDDLPAGIGQPTRSALALVGISRLEQLTAFSEKQILQLHGVGPKAVGVLRSALASKGLSFAADKTKED